MLIVSHWSLVVIGPRGYCGKGWLIQLSVPWGLTLVSSLFPCFDGHYLKSVSTCIHMPISSIHSPGVTENAWRKYWESACFTVSCQQNATLLRPIILLDPVLLLPHHLVLPTHPHCPSLPPSTYNCKDNTRSPSSDSFQRSESITLDPAGGNPRQRPCLTLLSSCEYNLFIWGTFHWALL